MSEYIFTNTERTRGKGADYETFSALYMITIHEKKENIEYILVDSFNDVSCSDNQVSTIYDIQSKGYKNITPGEIGRFLYTLFKNFQTDFPFVEFILCLETIKDNYIKNRNHNSHFKISDLKDETVDKIILGLKKEICERDKIKEIDDELKIKLNAFLSKLILVIISFTKSESIKKIIPMKNVMFKDEQFYESVFNDIRDKQSSLKNINLENKKIVNPKDVLQFNKYIKKKDITFLLINLIIGADTFNYKTIPNAFVDELNGKTKDDREDILLECNTEISRLFFDKNNKKNIWNLLAKIIDIVQKNPENNLTELYDKIPQTLLIKIQGIKSISVKYFISRVLEGIK